MDKYMMLIRHVTREAFNCLQKSNFDAELLEDYKGLLLEEGGIFEPGIDANKGIKFHVTDVFFDEVYHVFGNGVGELRRF